MSVIARAGVCVALLASLGCSSLLTHTTLLSDSSHLGTPYAGTRSNLHFLTCYVRGIPGDASSLLFMPFMLFPLVDLPLSLAADTILLPLDIPMTPEREPQVIGGGSCRLFGM